jgi:hypothetical protein
MYCTQCGTANTDEIRFCMNCGAPMVKRGDTPHDRSSSESDQPPSPVYPGQQSNPSYSGQPAYMGPPSVPTNPGGRASYTGPPSIPTDPGGKALYTGPASPYPMYPTEGNASGRAVISMILSIISPSTCLILLSVPGLILGKMELDAIRNGQAPKAGETFAKIGFYVGIVVTALSMVIPLIWLMFLAIF